MLTNNSGNTTILTNQNLLKPFLLVPDLLTFKTLNLTVFESGRHSPMVTRSPGWISLKIIQLKIKISENVSTGRYLKAGEQ